MANGGRAVQIRVTLEIDTADSVRLITMPGWTGAALMCSRAQYRGIRNRDDFERPGVYVLLGEGTPGDPRQQLYIGQTNAAGERLDNHRGRKGFWTDLILFTTTDDSLNTALCRHIEQRLYQQADKIGRVHLLNGNRPGGARLHPSDRDTADDYLRRMLLIYPLLGINAFVPAALPDPIPPAEPDPPEPDPPRTGPARTGPARTGPARTGPARTEPARTGPARTGPARTGPARTGFRTR